MYFILFIAIAVASYAVQASLKSKFSTYSKTPLSNGMTGAQVAEKMLHDNGINNVKVTQIEGQLTDHYNPATLTVNLSRNVYYGSSVAAAAVAAHECGHAVQHATKVTLPVEINASQRAMAWLSKAGITYGQTTAQAKDALKSAAYTYVVAALASLATLIYYIFIFLGRRD